MKTVALIFGRKNSKGLKNKNIKKINGKHMFSHVIDEVKKVKSIKDIYVSTDSNFIISKAKKKNCKIIQRPDFLTSDKALLSDAIYHAVEISKKREGKIDNFLILLCNSICFHYEEINKALKMIKKSKSVDTITTISKFNMFSPVRAVKIKNKKIENFIPNNILKKYTNLSGDRNKSTDAYFCNHSFTLSKAEVFNKPKKNPMPFQWMGKNKFFLEQEFCVGDIDFEWQLPVVEWWLKRKNKRLKK
jgi:CMP-N-acetylneuraminic acid synthetase